MMFQNHKELRNQVTAGGPAFDVFGKVEDERPNFLPPITPDGDEAGPSLKKKKTQPKIFDLTE